MKEYKIYGGLKYLIHDGKKPSFQIYMLSRKKNKKEKKIQKNNPQKNNPQKNKLTQYNII